MTDRELLISIQSQIAHQLECGDGTDITPPPVSSGPPEVIPPENSGPPPKGTNWEGWLWPVPFFDGEAPVISDGFRRHKSGADRQHLGVDILFKNKPPRTKRIPEQTKWYHMPSSTVPMLAMGPGKIWFAGLTSTGWTVQIDHGSIVGFPLVSYYTHMSELLIPEHSEGGGGMEVAPGLQLGFIGNSPKSEGDPNHCHSELWDYSEGVGKARVDRCLDPEPYLRCFGQLVLPVSSS